jgi:hypothetical protein
VGVQKEPSLGVGLNWSKADLVRPEKRYGENVGGKRRNSCKALKIIVKIESEIADGTTDPDYIGQSAAGTGLRLSYPDL